MSMILSPDELAHALGESITTLRLQKNITREMLARQAGVSLSALKHLETGQGANVHTLICAVKALGRSDWFSALAPKVSINPLQPVKDRPRQRARQRRANHGKPEK